MFTQSRVIDVELDQDDLYFAHYFDYEALKLTTPASFSLILGQPTNGNIFLPRCLFLELPWIFLRHIYA